MIGWRALVVVAMAGSVLAPGPVARATGSGGKVVVVKSKVQWDEELKAARDHAVVAMFCVHWDGPCKRVAPEFDTLAKKHAQLVFLSVNADDAPEVPGALDVSTYPTWEIYKSRKKIATTTELKTLEALVAKEQ